MEESIKGEKNSCPDIHVPEVILQELPNNDQLEVLDRFSTSLDVKADSFGMPCEPERQHLNAICLSIRIAIIRCFYSSSNCPSTALQMLKGEDSDLCVTVNVEDINFFVQKFEKTGTVIDNHMDSAGLEARDSVDTDIKIETVDSPLEDNVKESKEGGQISGPPNMVHILQADQASSDSQRPRQTPVKRKRKAPLRRKAKKDHNTPDHPEVQQPVVLTKRRNRKRGKIELSDHKFPPLGKNECRICKKKCPSKSLFIFHFLSHFNMTFLPKNGPHRCPGCDAYFELDNDIYRHLFDHCLLEKYDSSQDHQNSELAQNSNLEQSLDAAQTLHFTAYPESTQNWDSSQTPHLSQDPFPPAYSSSAYEITNEIASSSSQPSSSFVQEQLEQSDQEMDEDTSPSEKSKKKIHKCPRCPEILPNMRSLIYHVAEHFNLEHLNGDPPYKCPECDQIFIKKHFVYKHLTKTCHKGLRRPETPFSCHLCHKAFQFELQLNHHILVHSGKAKLRECNLCGKSFSTTTGFRNHLLITHAEKKGYQCDQCPRHFLRLKLLEEHKLSHSGTYLYVCQYCGKNCDNSKAFQAHLKRHTEKSERWMCEICGKDYSGQYNFKLHMRTHTGEVAAVCDLCGKGFIRRDNLKIHYKSCQRQMLGVNQVV